MKYPRLLKPKRFSVNRRVSAYWTSTGFADIQRARFASIARFLPEMSCALPPASWRTGGRRALPTKGQATA